MSSTTIVRATSVRPHFQLANSLARNAVKLEMAGSPLPSLKQLLIKHLERSESTTARPCVSRSHTHMHKTPVPQIGDRAALHNVHKLVE